MFLTLIAAGLLCPLLTHRIAERKPLLHAAAVGAFIGALILAILSRDEW
ncbi:hypothetical protein [Streptomyces aureoversilis]|uniref:Uncharacterized protein n=1 Tax=Streptomyces aureoversilis TaxID=67277 RepID=A0ABV9ZVU1_9ACTN